LRIFNNFTSIPSAPIIQNNTINASSATDSFGIHMSAGSGALVAPTIENNIISALMGASERYCVHETDANSDPTALRNNVLFDCPTALYRDEGNTAGNTAITDIAAVNMLMDTTSSGNISTDPMFVDRDGADDDPTTFVDNDWHLSGASPASVTGGGLDLSAQFTSDADGVARTAPWSIGAYEVEVDNPTTWTANAAPVFLDKCSPCHSSQGLGGHNIATNYDHASKPAVVFPACTGFTVGQCTIVLIQSGVMPYLKGCTGMPLTDAGNTACLTQAEQVIIQDWINDGLRE
jgi:hypothetical protein